VSESPLDREPEPRSAPAPTAPEPDPGSAPEPVAPPEPARGPTSTAARATLRRAPRFGRFAGVGVLTGAVLAALAAVLGPPGTTLGRGAIFLLVFLALGSLGALVGSLLAVVADRRSLTRR
jgi:hypothetical protein